MFLWFAFLWASLFGGMPWDGNGLEGFCPLPPPPPAVRQVWGGGPGEQFTKIARPWWERPQIRYFPNDRVNVWR